MKQIETEVLVIGAGLTGLTTAYRLNRQGIRAMVIERDSRVGGQIRTYHENGFVAESGPNTGVVSYPEIAELFADLAPDCILEVAAEASKHRLIWKGGHFHAIPTTLFEAIKTSLFCWYDKFRILGEPLRAKGTNPDESIADLTRRRLGESFLNYAVDPFLGGVYAGNPETLITRHALPKLYHLEQQYGSFVRGAIAKQKEQQSERDKLASKKVFSASGGLERLPEALAKQIGSEQIVLSATNLYMQPTENGWLATYTDNHHDICTIRCLKVVSTVGGYSLPDLFPFIPTEEVSTVSSLEYAPVVQVSVGFNDIQSRQFVAFGGLVPGIEKKKVLGILFPSSCFAQRCPDGGALFSFFLGGKRNPQLLLAPDRDIEKLIYDELRLMLHFPATLTPDYLRIFRHKQAIPQYEASTEARNRAIEAIEYFYNGLYLAGNIRDGIGMADRIKQGVGIANEITKTLKK